MEPLPALEAQSCQEHTPHCTCTHACTHTCTPSCRHTHAYRHTHIHTHTCVHTARAQTRAHTYIYGHPHVHTHKHTSAHTAVHTHTLSHHPRPGGRARGTVGARQLGPLAVTLSPPHPRPPPPVLKLGPQATLCETRSFR